MSRSFPRIVLVSILIVTLIQALGLAVFVNAPLATVVRASEGSLDWPMESHDPGRTRYSTSKSLDTGHLLWKSAPMNYSYPVVADGRLYVRAGYSTIQCFNATTGALMWNKKVVSQQIDYEWLGVQYPAVAYGRLYVPWASQPTGHGGLLCLDASTGIIIWNNTSGDTTVTVADGKAYLLVWNGTASHIECLDALTGSEIWVFDNGESGSWYDPVVVADGGVYVGYSRPGNTGVCLNASDGTVLAETEAVIAANQGILYSMYTYSEYPERISIRAALGPLPIAPQPYTYEWTSIWAYDRPLALSFPALAYGRIYIGYARPSDGGYEPRPNINGTVCLNATTGTLLWNYSAPGGMGAPAVADGKVYVGSEDHKLYCLHADTGSKVWSYTTDGPVSDPVIAKGIVYVTAGGRVYAFGSQRTRAAIEIGASRYDIAVDSNSLVSGLSFNQSARSIGFTVSGPSGRAAFCNVTFPVSLLGGPYTVLMNGSSVTPIQRSNSTHTVFFFTYTHNSSNAVEIVGTTAVPEFSAAIIPGLLVLATLPLIPITYRRKQR